MHRCLAKAEAVERALARIAQNHVPSSWIDSLAAGTLSPNLFDAIKVPEHGYLTSAGYRLSRFRRYGASLPNAWAALRNGATNAVNRLNPVRPV